LENPLAPHPEEILVLGSAGSIAVMNAHAWHGARPIERRRRVSQWHAFYCRRDKPQQQYQMSNLVAESLKSPRGTTRSTIAD